MATFGAKRLAGRLVEAAAAGAAGSGEPGIALATMAADVLVDSMKKMTASPPIVALPDAQAQSLSQNMSALLSVAVPTQGFNIPNTSFRDSVFNLSASIVRPKSMLQADIVQQAFDVTSVLEASTSPQKSLLQRFTQKPAETKDAAKSNEDIKKSSPTRNKI